MNPAKQCLLMLVAILLMGLFSINVHAEKEQKRIHCDRDTHHCGPMDDNDNPDRVVQPTFRCIDRPNCNPNDAGMSTEAEETGEQSKVNN